MSLRCIVNCCGRPARFDFIDRFENATYPSLTAHQKQHFAENFCSEVENVGKWFKDNGWCEDVIATFPNLQISVSRDFAISRSLVHGFLGCRGRMEFPAREAAVNENAIAHELTHVIFPSGNRMLAEGLATYIQCRIGRNRAFPNYGSDLDELVRAFTKDLGPHGLDLIDLKALDVVSTPAPLELRIGQKTYGNEASTVLYSIAGSFVTFLVDIYGVDRFHDLYLRTPLVPFERHAGAPERWREIYQVSLDDLQAEWKSRITA
jgi:hypothetical protein